MTRLGTLRFLSITLVLLLVTAATGPASARVRVSGHATFGYGHGVSISVGYGGHHHYGYRGHYYPYYGYRSYYRPYYQAYYYAYPRAYVGYPYTAAYVTPVVSEGGARRLGAIQTKVKPKKAQLFLDQQPIGQARDFNGPWDLLYVPAGRHTLEFRLAGWQTLRVELDVRAGGYYQIDEILLEGDGEDPRSDPAAPAEPASTTPPPTTTPATTADLSVSRAPQVSTPSLRQGRLYIAASPADAAIYLDGEFLARADELARLHGAIPVAQGEHTIDVVRPGYASDSLVVVVRDEPERVFIDLQPED